MPGGSVIVSALQISKTSASVISDAGGLCFGGTTMTPPQPHRAEENSGDHEDDWDQCDIDEFEPVFQSVDVIAQRRLNVAQLTPGLYHIGAELLDRLGLIG